MCAAGIDKRIAQILLSSKEKQIKVKPETVKKICDLIGSLPEEIAEKERSA